MNKLKTFENFEQPIEYPYDKMKSFVEWFKYLFGSKIKQKEHWTIRTKGTHGEKYINQTKLGVSDIVYFVNSIFIIPEYSKEEKNKEILENARKFGLMVNDDMVIIGYDGVSFLEHPEYLKTFRKKLQAAKDAEKFGL